MCKKSEPKTLQHGKNHLNSRYYWILFLFVPRYNFHTFLSSLAKRLAAIGRICPGFWLKVRCSEHFVSFPCFSLVSFKSFGSSQAVFRDRPDFYLFWFFQFQSTIRPYSKNVVWPLYKTVIGSPWRTISPSLTWSTQSKMKVTLSWDNYEFLVSE